MGFGRFINATSGPAEADRVLNVYKSEWTEFLTSIVLERRVKQPSPAVSPK